MDAAYDGGTWEEFIGPRDGDSEKTARLKRVLGEALSDESVPHIAERRRAAEQLTDLATRVWKSKESAGRKRTRAHRIQRSVAGASALAAAISGGALLTGHTSTHLWWVAAVAAAFSGLGAAVPQAEYERNRRKTRRYEQLWWDIRTYATLTLPTAEPASVVDQIRAFTSDIKDIGEA
jgi:hypothetical protein